MSRETKEDAVAGWGNKADQQWKAPSSLNSLCVPISFFFCWIGLLSEVHDVLGNLMYTAHGGMKLRDSNLRKL